MSALEDPEAWRRKGGRTTGDRGGLTNSACQSEPTRQSHSHSAETKPSTHRRRGRAGTGIPHAVCARERRDRQQDARDEWVEEVDG